MALYCDGTSIADRSDFSTYLFWILVLGRLFVHANYTRDNFPVEVRHDQRNRGKNSSVKNVG